MISSGNANESGNALTFTAVTSVPVRAAIAAPKEKLISFSELTGMPITSAASGSSRSDRQARPVRERLTKRRAT